MAIKYLTKEEFNKLYGDPSQYKQVDLSTLNADTSSSMDTTPTTEEDIWNKPSEERGFLGQLLQGFAQDVTAVPRRVVAQLKSAAPDVKELFGGEVSQAEREKADEGVDWGYFGATKSMTDGFSIENLKTLGSEGIRTGLATSGAGEGVNIAKQTATQGLKTVGKGLVSRSIRTGGTFGAGFGLAESLDEDATVVETIGNMLKGFALGTLTYPIAEFGIKGTGKVLSNIKNKGLVGGVEKTFIQAEEAISGIGGKIKGIGQDLKNKVVSTKGVHPTGVNATKGNMPFVQNILPNSVEDATLKTTTIDNLRKGFQDIKTNAVAPNAPQRQLEQTVENTAQKLKSELDTTGKTLTDFIDNSVEGQKKVDLTDLISSTKPTLESITGHVIDDSGYVGVEGLGGSKVSPKDISYLNKLLQDIRMLGETPTVQEIDHLLKKWDREGQWEKALSHGVNTKLSKAYMEIESNLMSRADAVAGERYAGLRNEYSQISKLYQSLNSGKDTARFFANSLTPGSEAAQFFQKIKDITGEDITFFMKALDATDKATFGAKDSLIDMALKSANEHIPIGQWGQARTGLAFGKKLINQNILKLHERDLTNLYEIIGSGKTGTTGEPFVKRFSKEAPVVGEEAAGQNAQAWDEYMKYATENGISEETATQMAKEMVENKALNPETKSAFIQEVIANTENKAAIIDASKKTIAERISFADKTPEGVERELINAGIDKSIAKAEAESGVALLKNKTKDKQQLLDAWVNSLYNKQQKFLSSTKETVKEVPKTKTKTAQPSLDLYGEMLQ